MRKNLMLALALPLIIASGSMPADAQRVVKLGGELEPKPPHKPKRGKATKAEKKAAKRARRADAHGVGLPGAHTVSPSHADDPSCSGKE